MLVNDACVLALDFNGGSSNGQLNDLSTYGHHAQIEGSPEFTEGGAPIIETDLYMTVDGTNYL